MPNALSTTSTALDKIMRLSVGDIKTKDQARECYQYGVLAGKVSSHLKRVAVTACIDKLSMTRKDTGELLSISANQVTNLLGDARAVQMAKPAKQGARGTVMTGLPVEKPEQLSELLPTQRDVKAYAKAPVEVKEQVVALANTDFPTVGPDYPDRMIEHVRSLINPETWEIDTSNHTDEQKDDMLKQLNTTLEATQSMFAMYNMQTQPYFGGISDTGRYDWYEWLTIIKNVSKELTSAERISAIKHLMSQLDDADRQKLVDSIISPIN